MRAIERIFTAIAEALAPDGRLMRIRFRTTVDSLTTFAVTLLAIVLAVGYQVFGRWARRSGRVD